MRRIRRRPGGFTLVELLIVVAIIGILVAISVINYMSAIQRAKQRRSMSDIRALSSGLEAYAIDLGRYPPASGYTLPAGLSLPTATLGSVGPYLSPTYLKHVPLSDGWSSWLNYGPSDRYADYAIRSVGRDGEAQTNPTYGPTTAFDDDIVLVNGQFVQYPDGVQR